MIVIKYSGALIQGAAAAIPAGPNHCTVVPYDLSIGAGKKTHVPHAINCGPDTNV